MKKRIIVLLAAAVIITAAVFFALKDRDSQPEAAEAVIYAESPDYLALETDEVIRIKKLRIRDYYKEPDTVKIKEIDDTAAKNEFVKIKDKPAVAVIKDEKISELEKEAVQVEKTELPQVEKNEIVPEIAVVEEAEGEMEVKDEELPDEKSDIFTDKELFAVETPDDRSFYRKKVFISGKTLDAELIDFSWKTENSEPQKIETDYAGEFGFYIPSEELTESLKIYITAVKADGNRHEKLLVLFNKNVKPEIIIKRPHDKYEFGKFITIEGSIGIPGHERYIKDLIKEARISLSPAGIEEDLEVMKNGKFRHVITADKHNMFNAQKMTISISLNNFKSSSETVEIFKSSYDLVDYKISAGDKSVAVSWDNIPVEAGYRIKLSREGGDIEVLDNIKSPLKISNLLNNSIYNLQLEAEQLDTDEILTGKSEKVLPLDPYSIKPSADGGFGRIKVKWDPADGAEKYDLFRKSVRQGRESAMLTDFSGSSFLDENVSPSETYIYSVEPHGIISVRSAETSSKPSTGGKKKIHEIKQIDEFEKIKNILVVNNYGYLITESGIVIADITDFRDPVYAGHISAQADYLSVDEEYCYIISLKSGLEIYDISNPSKPEQVVRREQYKGDYIWSEFPHLFINEKDKGIRILNIEQPDMPAKAGLHTGLKFSENPVSVYNEELFMTAFDEEGKIFIYKIKQDGKFDIINEIKTGSAVLKAQSFFVKEEMITAVLNENKKILFYKPAEKENTIVRHLIDNNKTADFNFFTSYDGRAFLSVLRENMVDFYSIDPSGEAVFFTSLKKNADDLISVCSDSSGYAYLVKSENGIKLYRMMTEGVSFINNSYNYPDKVHDFLISKKYITALTEDGIYYSERDKYYPEPVLLSEGKFRSIWANPHYAAAVNSDYNFTVFPDYINKPLIIDREDIKGKKALSAGDYSVILNGNSEILIFSYDITKNAPHLHASLSGDRIRDIFTFSDGKMDYSGIVTEGSVEIFGIINEGGVIKVSEIKTEQAEKVKCRKNYNSVFIDLYTDDYIRRFLFIDNKIKEIFTEENSDDNISIYGDLIVKSGGENGISIYKNINGLRTLVSRCSGIFSFDTYFYEGKIYSKGFNTVEEVVPVIPDWFK